MTSRTKDYIEIGLLLLATTVGMILIFKLRSQCIVPNNFLLP